MQQSGRKARDLFANQLRRVIGQQRGVQQRFASETGVSPSTVSRWLTGRVLPSAESVNRLCRSLTKEVSGRLLTLHEEAILEREHAADKPSTLRPHVLEQPDGASQHRSWVLHVQDDLYAAASGALEHAFEHGITPASLDWASLHGMGGRREDDLGSVGGVSDPIQRFEGAINAILADDGARRWRVRQVLNVDTEHALERVMARLEAREGCGADYEVWAYSVRDAPPVLSPLILCGHWVFFATEHQRTYRASSGVRIDGDEAGTWATGYMNQLVRHANFAIRTAGGIDRHAVRRLRSRLQELA